jgi:hypothetical protein
MATNLKNIKASALTSVITSVASSGIKITGLTYTGSATAANPAGGETVTVNGSGFNTGAKVYIDTVLCTTTYVSNTSLTFTSPIKTIGSYFVYVYNTDGSSGLYPLGMIYSSLPTWVTSSGALTDAGQNSLYSQSVSATGDGTITYSLTGGSLPSGLSLNSSTGAITGTAPNTIGTSTFTITASDGQNQTTSRSFSIQVIIPVVSSVDYLVVAGGGGAGYSSSSGGGGGGGFRTATGLSVISGVALTVTVGGGGPGATSAGAGSKGSDSVFSSITATGGGYGAYDNAGGGPGGSGGGAGLGNFSPNYAGGAGNTPSTSPSQGNNGGASTGNGSTKFSGGGGGGAGAVGETLNLTSGTRAASGGAGALSNYSGTNTYYAGGGAAGKDNRATGLTSGAGFGGIGGGGAGVASSATPGGNGDPNTGGGGGGGCYDGSVSAGGSGGSGIVIIRYPDTYPLAASTTGSPTITNPTGYRVYKFTSSGSITF